jgi:hypothetical protein
MACTVGGFIKGGVCYDDSAEEIKLLSLECLWEGRQLVGKDIDIEVKTYGEKVKFKRELMKKDAGFEFADHWLSPREYWKLNKSLVHRKRHEIKIAPEYYEAIKSGRKNFELRKNDRDYKVGDILILSEFGGEQSESKEPLVRIVEYVLKDCEQYGLKEGYCILGFYNRHRLP